MRTGHSFRIRVLLAAAVLALLTGWSSVNAQTLDILVFGASGRIGSLVVDEALARGHRVTAVSRTPEEQDVSHANLTWARGDLLDAGSIARVVAEQDVVVLSVRGILGEKLPENALQYIGVQSVAAALSEIENAPRLVHVGGAGSLLTDSGERYAEQLPRIFLPKRFEAELDGQVLALDFLRGIDNVSWTYITPPRNFTNGERTGTYRIGGDRMLEDRRGRSRISRADFAVAVLDEAERGNYINERISLAY